MSHQANPGARVRQLSPQEREALEHEASECAAEIDAGPAGPAGLLRRVVTSVSRAAATIRGVMTRENFDLALERSAGFAKLAAQYGAQAAKEAVLRKMKRTVEDAVNGAIGK